MEESGVSFGCPFGAILVIWGTKISQLVSQDDAKGMFKLEISVLAKTLKKLWFFNDFGSSEVSKTIKMIEKIVILPKNGSKVSQRQGF